MKVKNNFFVIALILSLVLAVGVVSAAEDISFEQSNTNKISNNPDINQGYSKLSANEAENENAVGKLSQSPNGGGGKSTPRN